MSDALLSVRDLSAGVDGKEILHSVDLDVEEGGVHVLMGPNGAGKSTLGHVIMGEPTYDVTGGTIMFGGEDVTDLSPDKRSLAGMFLSFQAPVEIPGVPLSSFLRAIASARPELDMKRKEFRKRVRELADELDMDRAYLDRELGVGFSGGEKKKVEMLQLLLLKPRLAILDEADSGLDVDALSVVSRGMELYRRECNGTLLVITHNTRILEHLDVDKVHVMVRGRMVAEGDASMIADIDTNGFEQFESLAQARNGAAMTGPSEKKRTQVDDIDPQPVRLRPRTKATRSILRRASPRDRTRDLREEGRARLDARPAPQVTRHLQRLSHPHLGPVN